MPDLNKNARPGAAIYTKPILSLYNLIVLRFSNDFVWRCPTPSLLDFYNKNISSNHLDVGVGTGYFLNNCSFPSDPQVTLVDLNPHALEVTSRVLERYKPLTYLGNALEPLPITQHFDSIGLSYLLHCLPGPMLSKTQVFSNLKPLLNKGGIVFGTTILGQGVKQNFLAKQVQNIYNATKIFDNSSDDVKGLEKILGENFETYEVQIKGCVALFAAR